MDFKKLGERFKRVRERFNLTQEELAEKINTHQNKVSRFERGLGASTQTIIDLLIFYSSRIYINFIFEEDEFFKIVEKPKGEIKVGEIQGKLTEVSFEKIASSLEEARKDIVNAHARVEEAEAHLHSLEKIFGDSSDKDN